MDKSGIWQIQPYIWISQGYGRYSYVFGYIKDMVNTAVYLDILGKWQIQPNIWVYQGFGKYSHIFGYITDKVDNVIYLDKPMSMDISEILETAIYIDISGIW